MRAARFEAAWGAPIPPQYGWHLTQMFDAMERGELRTLYVDRREPGAVGGRRQPHAHGCSRGSTTSSCRTSFMTRTAELADVVLPGTASLVRGRGHGDEQRAPRPARAQGARPARRGARRHRGSSASSRGGSATTGVIPRAEEVWDELRSLSPDARRDELRAARGAGRHPVAVPRRGAPGLAVPARAAVGRAGRGAARAVQRRRARRRRSTRSTPTIPIRLTTGRRLDSFNTGVQERGYRSPLAPRRGARALARGRRALGVARRRARPRRLAARRGRGAGARSTPALRPGLAFMTFHFPDEVDDERAHDRRHRPEVGHRRVQGDGDPRRPARARRARGWRDRPRACGGRASGPALIADAEPTPGARRDRRGARAPVELGGGARLTGADGNTAAGGHAARARRHLLLPALRAAQRADRLDQPGRARTRSAAGSTCRRRTPTASRASTRCSRSSRGRRASSTSATTSRAGTARRS